MHSYRPSYQVPGEHQANKSRHSRGRNSGNPLTALHKQFDLLAAHGRLNLWSFCDKKFTDTYTQRRLDYNVDKAKSNNAFDVDTCVSVYSTIVPE